MSNVMIEAVPNFSEGRHPAVMAALVVAIQAPGVLLLNHSADWDHNRMVITVAGPPDAVLEGLFRATQVAAERIDLFAQRGQHPRLGATDVIPLIPIQNCTLDDCVALAHQLGQRIGTELQLPVYLYEAAATRPERRNLVDVRKGQFEKLVAEIDQPERRPDYGPAQVGPAGAVIVGARHFLVAYNIYLQSADVGIATAIARTVRASSGGLPGVKALGLMVNGQAQVSMNLTDLEVTPLHVAVEAVRAAAAQHKVAVDRSELIGLLPQSAIIQAAAYYLQLPAFDQSRIFEEALRAADHSSQWEAT